VDLGLMALASQSIQEDLGGSLAAIRGGAEIRGRAAALNSAPDCLGDLPGAQSPLERVRGDQEPMSRARRLPARTSRRRRCA
jgi:hypothetical protein